MFGFFLGNRSLSESILGGFDPLEGATDPGLGSAMEQAFAIFINVLDVADDGTVTNAEIAANRAAQ